MKSVDWPLAITLAIMFVVISVVRWRSYTRRRAKQKPGSGESGRES